MRTDQRRITTDHSMQTTELLGYYHIPPYYSIRKQYLSYLPVAAHSLWVEFKLLGLVIWYRTTILEIRSTKGDKGQLEWVYAAATTHVPQHANISDEVHRDNSLYCIYGRVRAWGGGWFSFLVARSVY